MNNAQTAALLAGVAANLDNLLTFLDGALPQDLPREQKREIKSEFRIGDPLSVGSRPEHYEMVPGDLMVLLPLRHIRDVLWTDVAELRRASREASQ